ncbi:hypothetical protein J5I95_23895 [Candidatus Poribacteria bacterium]|nr:hypothetical protein [Candidatus Poribacteria bacterium]
MKRTSFFILLTLLIFSTLYLLSSVAQDYTQWGLPEGAKVRIGKGRINEITYSPDGTQLAVATSIGIWVYNMSTHQGFPLTMERGTPGPTKKSLCSSGAICL